MNIEALYHAPVGSYIYAYNEKELHIRLRTARGDLDRVTIIFGNKYRWDTSQHRQDMKKVYRNRHFDYYQYEIKEEDFRIGYYFELVKAEETLYYTETGIVTVFDDAMAYCYFFQYPYMNSVDVHKQPTWIHDAIFYQIFVERFYNGDVENSPPGLAGWEDDPQPKSFFGGDLRGIIEKLDYLSELGINGIYLTPIFTSPSNHKYDTVNYFEIDPYFGSKEVFRELVDKAHERGIKIVLDAVFNHCSNSFPPFLDVTLKGRKSEYYDWFFIDGDEVLTNPPNYRTFSYVGYMPKLNTQNPGLKEYLLSCVRYWTKEFAIDGWRLDVSDEIDHKFWREFRDVVKGMNEDAIIIGENWHNSLPWLEGDQFDSVMNYPVTKLCLDFFARRNISAETFSEQLGSYFMRYPEQVNEAMLNLLDSHDTERFLYTAGGDKESLKNAAAFLFAYKGIPCTYYGTEIGMTGSHDPGCRKGFDWRTEYWDEELFELYKRLIALRKEERSLQLGDLVFESTKELFVMRRTYKEDCILVLINQTDSTQEYSIEDGISWAVELLTDQSWDCPREGMRLFIPAKTAYYIKLRK